MTTPKMTCDCNLKYPGDMRELEHLIRTGDPVSRGALDVAVEVHQHPVMLVKKCDCPNPEEVMSYYFEGRLLLACPVCLKPIIALEVK